MTEKEKTKSVCLDTNGLTGHMFITGITDSGKTNAIYQILDNLCPEKDDYNNDDVRFLNIVGDRIYFGINDRYDDNDNLRDFGKLHSMRIDGSDKIKLADDDMGYIQLLGSKIFYAAVEDTINSAGSQEYAYILYSINTDGSGRQKIS